jgi:hypothetical protein
MFNWLNKQGVESDEGFVVQFTDRFTLEYTEKGRTTTLKIETGSSGNQGTVHIASEAFAEPRSAKAFRAERASSEEQDRKIENVRRALEFQGLKLVVE